MTDVLEKGVGEADREVLKGYLERECGMEFKGGQMEGFEGGIKVLLSITGCRSMKELVMQGELTREKSLRDMVMDLFASEDCGWKGVGYPWDDMFDKVFSELLPRVKNEQMRSIRVWNTFCRGGEDIYRMGMLIDEYIRAKVPKGVRSEDIEYVGTDISPSMLFMAAAGRYHERGMACLEEKWKRGNFEEEGGVWMVREDLRKRMEFKKWNAIDGAEGLGSFDFVLYRPVSNYLGKAMKDSMLRGIGEAVTEGGYLYCGEGEEVGELMGFDREQVDGILYYKKR